MVDTSSMAVLYHFWKLYTSTYPNISCDVFNRCIKYDLPYLRGFVQTLNQRYVNVDHFPTPAFWKPGEVNQESPVVSCRMYLRVKL